MGAGSIIFGSCGELVVAGTMALALPGPTIGRLTGADPKLPLLAERCDAATHYVNCRVRARLIHRVVDSEGRQSLNDRPVVDQVFVPKRLLRKIERGKPDFSYYQLPREG